jgi:hypothetical protein
MGREHRTEQEITAGRDPNLWALDLDSALGNQPVRAHLIVDTSINDRGDEVRRSACGITYTKWLDNHGWWGSHSGELAMAVEHTHCGANQIR